METMQNFMLHEKSFFEEKLILDHCSSSLQPHVSTVFLIAVNINN